MKLIYLYPVAVAFLWSTTGIFIKFLEEYDYSEILFVRALISAIIVFLVIARPIEITRHRFILLLPMVFYYTFATSSFIFAPIALVTTLLAMTPCFNLIIDYFRERQVNKKSIMGISVCIFGIFLYYSESIFILQKNSSNLLIGGVLALLASISRAINADIIWNNKGEFDIKQISFFTFLVLTIITFPFQGGKVLDVDFEDHDLIYFFSLSLISTLSPLILNNYSSKIIEPFLNSAISLLTPAFASILAWYFFNQSLTILQIISILLILIGVLYSIKARNQIKIVN